MKTFRGFSLLETLVFIMVVGIALTGVMGLFIQNTSSSAEPLMRARTLVVAQAYLDEIIAKRFDENTPVGGGCVETGTNSCTAYCAAYSDVQCVQSQCKLQGSGNCVPKGSLSGFGTEEGSREAYDDLDDYHGITEAPTGIAGAAADYTGFSVQVSVTLPSASWEGIDPRDLRHVQVDVTSPLGETLSLEAYRVNF